MIIIFIILIIDANSAFHRVQAGARRGNHHTFNFANENSYCRFGGSLSDRETERPPGRRPEPPSVPSVYQFQY